MHKLTKEQKKFAEKNHNLIFDFLRNNRLNYAEYYDLAALGYLGAVQAYHENDRARQYEFKTIASRKMRDSVFNQWRFNGRLKRKAYLVDFDKNAYENQGLLLSEMIDSGKTRSEDLVSQRLMIEEAMKHMTEKEKKVVCLKAAGYTGREIGMVCGTTAAGIYGRLYRMRKRLKHALAG
ncbi:MAG: hypothetical protein LBT06_10435 [Hungatella sp.]|jgi:RNA polymerase sigma-70 factor (ECF subfamily)|nr:hypothetical protein [Hungatella sp.]